MKKVAIITGSTRGIGKEIALQLAKDGFILVLCATGTIEESLKKVSDIAEICPELSYSRCDIAQAEDRNALITGTVEKYGRIDLLVNNAGVAPKHRADLLDMTEESFDYCMDINLKGTFFLTQLAAKHMGAGAKIVNINSVSAYAASVNRGEYCMSKAALTMATKLFALRLAEDGINVYEIRPGIIETDMTSQVKEKYDALIDEGISPIKRWGRPQDVAKIVSAIAGDALPFSTGEVINVDGGFHIARL